VFHSQHTLAKLISAQVPAVNALGIVGQDGHSCKGMLGQAKPAGFTAGYETFIPSMSGEFLDLSWRKNHIE